MELDNGIQIGDWITCSYVGYWQVMEIKPAYLHKQLMNMVVVIKKAFTAKMRFTVQLNCCAIDWCQKVSEEKKKDIEDYFYANPDKKKVFDEYDKPIVGECMSWRIDLPDEMIFVFNNRLKELPEKFTIKQFNRFVDKIGLRKFMKGMASRGKYILWIKSYPWLVDRDYNKVFFAPEIILK